ncbi:MAG: hypothetical protein IPN86_21175 [Saprospiraceae bacterium]|nr:hypothetical protein [Saprospiraceae bacterium]
MEIFPSKEKFVKNFKGDSSKVIEIQNQIDSYYKGQRVALENQRKEEESRKSKLKLYGPDAIHRTEWRDDSGMSWGNFKRCSIEYVDGTKGLVCLVGGVHTLDPGSLSAAKLEYSSFEFAAKAAYRLAKSEILPNEGRIWRNRAGFPSERWHTKNINYNDQITGLVFDGKHLYYRPSYASEFKISPSWLRGFSKQAEIADSEVINFKSLSSKWLFYTKQQLEGIGCAH